ncbi:GntR family transcriptional regulator [Aminicella lysinilytica]|uniref:GntR family transcriptional regulator n=1 Tax=Aminicella lysinilytica TaxID=433323 RepID=A0A4R6QBW3_9FIRM|nr:GntR family transcriptional regulator [Aminicella lysinilytica]NLD10831.1 GntR family transcriptional regulator [Clostridiales bacterium]TDP59775.1 GntR family transcriptional regulator [Aminicella lysinilytica]
MEKFKSLKDHVYDYIAEQILEGKLAPEQKINESVICEKLSISRTPVREALIQLSSEGVLKNMARKGFVVKALSEKEVAELYSVIGVLDGYAAKLAVNNLTDKDLANMDFYIESMDLAIKASNFEMYHIQQIAFHNIYLQECGNETLIDTIEKMKSKLLKKSYVDDEKGRTKEILLTTNEEHRKILELFKKKDGEALAKYLLDVHWTQTYAEFDAII